MKRIILLIIISCLYKIVIAQTPESFSYQAIVRNSAGETVVSRTVTFRFSILMGNVSGIIVYSETHSVTVDQYGMVTLAIGEGSDKTGNLAMIPWHSDKFFLKVEMDVTGGTNFIDMGTTQLLIIPPSSPAKRSKKSSLIIEEDGLFITRKYVGSFIEYRHTGFEINEGPNLIWIKTSMENTYGKISAYGKKCEFSGGDNLYLRRTYYTPGGISGYWTYQIENDSSIYYKLTDFQNDKKVFVESWFK
jgi:hypothetical protein